MFSTSNFKTSPMSLSYTKNSMAAKLMILKISVTICFELTAIAINNGLIENDIEERYNFKPIYAASSYIGKLDITSI